MSDTCVYLHTRKSDGKVFYVGIGVDYRPFSTDNRNQWWHNVAAKHGYEVCVVSEGLEWSVACDVERELIANYRFIGQPLVNLTDGGDGVKGWSTNPMNADWRRNLAKAMKELAQDPEWRRNNAEAMKKVHADPEWHRKHTEVVNSPEWRRKNDEAVRKRSANPEWQRNHADAMRTPENRAKKSKSNRASVNVAINIANLYKHYYTSLVT